MTGRSPFLEALQRAVQRAEQCGSREELLTAQVEALREAQEECAVELVASLSQSISAAEPIPGHEAEALEALIAALQAKAASPDSSADALRADAASVVARAREIGCARTGYHSAWRVAQELGDTTSPWENWADMPHDALTTYVDLVDEAVQRVDRATLEELTKTGPTSARRSALASLLDLDRLDVMASAEVADRLWAILGEGHAGELAAYESLARHAVAQGDPSTARAVLETSAHLLDVCEDPRARVERARSAVALARAGEGGAVLVVGKHVTAQDLEATALRSTAALARAFDQRNGDTRVSASVREGAPTKVANDAANEDPQADVDWDAALAGLLEGPAAEPTAAEGDLRTRGEVLFGEGRTRPARALLLELLLQDPANGRAHETLLMTELLRDSTTTLRSHLAALTALGVETDLGGWMVEFLDALDERTTSEHLWSLLGRAPVATDADRGVLTAGVGVHAGDDDVVRSSFVLLDGEPGLLAMVDLAWWTQRGARTPAEVVEEMDSNAPLLDGLEGPVRTYHEMEWGLLKARLVGHLGHHDQTRDLLDGVLQASLELEEHEVQAEALLDKGRSLLALGDLEGADSALTQAAIFGDGPRWLWGQLVEVHVEVLVELGRGEAALRRVEDALAGEPSEEERASLQRVRASALVCTGRVRDGIQAYEDLASELLGSGREALAGMLFAELANQAQALHPRVVDAAEVMLRSADAFARGSRPYEQVQALRHAANLFNNSYREDRALEAVQVALTLAAAAGIGAEQVLELHLSHSAVLRDVGRSKDALAVLDVAGEIAGGDVDALLEVEVERALALGADGRHDEAVLLMEKALEEDLDPERRARLMAGLAAALERGGRVVSAVRVRRALLDLKEPVPGQE